MAQKRRKDEIISQILTICQGGMCKTRIVYYANLNFRTVNPYLDNLLANELLEATEDSVVIYKTTKKGELVLDYMNKIDELMPIKMTYSKPI